MSSVSVNEKKGAKSNRLELVYIFLSALLPSFSFFVYAPLQLYFGNKNEFWFDFLTILGPITLCMLVVFALLFGAGIIIKNRKFRLLYGALLLGVGLAVFIQGDYINLDLGVLNGAQVIWRDHFLRVAANALVWVIIILASLIAAMQLGRKYMKPACIAAVVVLLLQLVTLSVLGFFGEEKNASPEYATTTRGLFDLSEKDNVVVFLMDMFDSRYMDQIIYENDPLLEELDNFTYYRNHAGSYSTTSYSIASLFINDHIDNSYPSLGEALNAQYNTENNIFPRLLEEGVTMDLYSIGMIPDELYHQSTGCEKKTNSRIESISDYPGFIKQLYELCAMKFAPDCFKPFVWTDSNAFNSFERVSGEYGLYPLGNIELHNLFKNKQIIKDDARHFKFIYANGAHYPYENDEDFNPVYTEDYSHSGAMATAKSSLKLCIQYMDMMKAADVYDNTTVIIMADHGYYWDGVLTNPIMMIKPANSKGDFAISDAPTSHINFQGTVAAAFGINDTEKYGVSICDIPEDDDTQRFFYQYNLQEDSVNGKHRLIEYTISPEGNERKMFALTDREILEDGTEIVHHEHCIYCQENGMEPLDLPNDDRIMHRSK